MILHAVALRWNDKAWLITARSGVGKSTQAKYLQELCPGEFGIICGDRPILEFRENDIIAHPSPWNGKENWHGAEKAPLGGVILLERGDENRIESLSPKEAAIPVYVQVIQNAVEAEKIHKSTALITRLLKNVPIWRLTTHQVPDSTRLLLEKVFIRE